MPDGLIVGVCAAKPVCHYGPHVLTCDEGKPTGVGALTCTSSKYERYVGSMGNFVCKRE